MFPPHVPQQALNKLQPEYETAEISPDVRILADAGYAILICLAERQIASANSWLRVGGPSDKIRKNLFSERIGHKWDESWITF
jgi:hypothetical protein